MFLRLCSLQIARVCSVTLELNHFLLVLLACLPILLVELTADSRQRQQHLQRLFYAIHSYDRRCWTVLRLTDCGGDFKTYIYTYVHTNIYTYKYVYIDTYIHIKATCFTHIFLTLFGCGFDFSWVYNYKYMYIRMYMYAIFCDKCNRNMTKLAFLYRYKNICLYIHTYMPCAHIFVQISKE